MRKNQGITLIALIITIIVMLILVGVVVTVVIQSDLLGTAKTAGDKYKIAYEEESNMSGVTINGKQYGSIEEYMEEINPTIVEPEFIEDWEYTEKDDKTINISSYRGADTEIIFPNYINNKPVKELGFNSKWSGAPCNSIISKDTVYDGYYANNNKVTKITLSPGIETIGAYCFQGLVALNEIILPNSIKTIRDSSFAGCKGLKEITIPSSVTTMGAGVFVGIPSITVHVPWKEGEKPEGWEDGWNGTYSDCTITVDYAK